MRPRALHLEVLRSFRALRLRSDTRFNGAMASLETIPGQKGFLVIATDGAVVQSGGELQNDEHTAEVMLRLLKNGQKLVNTLGSEPKTKMHRLSVCYKNHTLVASVWNHRVHVVKRINPET